MNEPAQPVEGERLALVRITRQMIAELIRGRIMVIDAPDASIARMNYDVADDCLVMAIKSKAHRPIPEHHLLPYRTLTCREIGGITIKFKAHGPKVLQGWITGGALRIARTVKS